MDWRMMMTRASLFGVGRAAVGTVLLGMGLGVGGAASAQEVTFARDIAPLLQESCQSCHRAGSLAPMSLVTYAEVRPWARSIKNRVMTRSMPPWHVDKTVGYQRFINDTSLSDEQIDMVVRWVDDGAPLGNPNDLPSPVEWPVGDRFALESEIGAPDLVVTGPAWTMVAEGQDQWMDQRVDVDLPETRWVRAIETRPSAGPGRRITHHASSYLYQRKSSAIADAEAALRRGEVGIEAVIEAMQQPADEDAEEVREFFTEWATGKQGEVYTENVGKIIRAGADFGFDVHTHAVGEELVGNMELGIWFYPKESPPKYNAQFMALGAGSGYPLEIEPNTVSEHRGTFVLPAPTILHNFQPHMHYRGKGQMLEAVYPNGRREVVNFTDRFDNTWNLNYIYDPDFAPLFPKGTVLTVTSWFDNTSANPNNPDPNQFVTSGSRTVDEMAHLNEQMIYLTQADYETLVAERAAREQTNDEE
jgi:hypothetical protein